MAGKILTFIIIVILIFELGYAGSLYLNRQQVISPHIVPDPSSQPPIAVTKTFPFEKNQITITVTVNTSVYQGARSADKSVRITGNVSDATWISKSYVSMADDPAQEGMYRDLIDQFRKIKDRDNLSDDEYLELITVYVQSLRYETLEENPVKFPVETVVEGAGDCDDKSLLLAGLLSREGYQVALLSFGPETHMALGAASDYYHYKGTNYTFIETTNLSYIGVPTEKLGAGKILQSMPLLIPVGNGIRQYTSAAQTRYIDETEYLTEQKAAELEPQVKNLEADLRARQQEILQMESSMLALKNTGNVREYNALVGSHNAKVSDYNSQRESYRQMYSRYEIFALVHNYIIEHPYDRKGVYAYIRANLPG